MLSAKIEEILARCLVEPAFLARVREDVPAALAPYGLDAATLRDFAATDFATVRRFSGFIGKVQHNHLWQDLPLTRKLLRRYGIELEVFSDYRTLQLAPRLESRERSDGIREFVQFLRQFIEQHERSHSRFRVLRDVLEHEYTVWTMRRLTNAASRRDNPVADVELRWQEFRQLVPAINGNLCLRTFSSNPLNVDSGDSGADAKTRAVRPRPCLLAYWQAEPQQGLRVFELDRLSAVALERVDARRSVRSIVEHLRRHGLDAVPPRAFQSLFAGAARTGIIHLKQGA